MTDARKHPRYPAKRGVLALLSIPLEIAARLGELVDLSEGGLAFVYSGDNEPYTGPAEVEVFGFEPPESSIRRVRCRVVYEKTFGKVSPYQHRDEAMRTRVRRILKGRGEQAPCLYRR